MTNGLINLFALFSLYSEHPGNSRKRVISYLFLSYGKKTAEEFLNLYDDLLDLYLTTELSKEQWMENAAQVIDKLKSKVSRKEIILIYLRLLELLSESLDSDVNDLINTISSLFEIDSQLQLHLYKFVHYDTSLSNLQNIVLISAKNNNNYHNHIERNINSSIIILYIEQINVTVVKIFGNYELFIESRLLNPLSFQVLENGDSISGYNIVPVYYSEIIKKITEQNNALAIVFESEVLEYKFPNGNYGLRSFSFCEESGSMIAIMGCSGAGKSTLLNILNGSIKPSVGRLFINGFDIHKDSKSIEGIIGFVPQDDMLLEDLSVYQNLYYSAKLSFSDLNDSEINEKVKKTLSQLDLLAIQDLKVGSFLNKSISGGQRKRLNIAIELIREPSIMLVDEPTSGLSSSDSEKVIQLLREQANSGKLIIINIHQPSSRIFKMFDSLWILDKGAYLIYKGSPLDAITYFKTNALYNNPEIRECSECGAINPELIFKIIEDTIVDSTGLISDERKNTPADWNRIFLETNNLNRKISIEKPSIKIEKCTKPGKWEQFLIFFKRNLKIKLSNKPYIMITLLQTPVLALILSYFTYYSSTDSYSFIDNKLLPIYIFMSVIVSLFSGMMASAEEIIKDRTVLKREKFLNLSWTSYLNSKVIFLFLISAFQSFVFVLIANSILKIDSQFLLYWSILFSTSCVANLIGLNLSNTLSSSAAIYILIPVILIPQILLGGLIIEYDDIPFKKINNNNVPFIGNVASSRWAYEAIAVGQYRYNNFQNKFFNLEKNFYNLSYYNNILLYELSRKLKDYDKINHELFERDKFIITNELRRVYQNFPVLAKQDVSSDIDWLDEEIQTLRNQFRIWRSQADKALNEQFELVKNDIGSEKFESLKRSSVNNALADLVRKSNSTRFYIETKTNLIRLYAPIFKNSDSMIGSAHFYAADKSFLNYYIETPFFNVIVMFFQAVLLYLLLLFRRCK